MNNIIYYIISFFVYAHLNYVLNHNSFSRAKIIPVTLALKTTKYLFEEREYMPWQSALNNLDYFYLMFSQTDVYELLQVCKILHIYRKKKKHVAELYVN